jgi:hypothetical protein
VIENAIASLGVQIPTRDFGGYDAFQAVTNSLLQKTAIGHVAGDISLRRDAHRLRRRPHRIGIFIESPRFRGR